MSPHVFNNAGYGHPLPSPPNLITKYLPTRPHPSLKLRLFHFLLNLGTDSLFPTCPPVTVPPATCPAPPFLSGHPFVDLSETSRTISLWLPSAQKAPRVPSLSSSALNQYVRNSERAMTLLVQACAWKCGAILRPCSCPREMVHAQCSQDFTNRSKTGSRVFKMGLKAHSCRFLGAWDRAGTGRGSSS